MKLKTLPHPGEPGEQPNYEELYGVIRCYRDFVGTQAAFYIEYLYWRGEFESREEEMAFTLGDESPEPYEKLEKELEDVRLSEAENWVRMTDAKRDRKLSGWLAILLVVPYLLLAYYLL